MLRKAVCALGEEAAEQFYWPGRFTRKRALPLFALTLIQDLKSVMVLNDEDHQRRKAMFLAACRMRYRVRAIGSGAGYFTSA
jgi:fatty-acid peroxygenase